MATFTVTSLGDVTAADGVTTLREALVLAAGNSEADTIVFGAPVAAGGVISLTQGQLVLTSDISINGDLDGDGTADVTIDAEGNSRVLSLNGAGTDVALMGLTIQGGAADRGAGIRLYSGVSLDVTNSTITGNAASSRGGGLYNQGGTVTMAGSTISGNTSSDDGGGAFIQSGSLTATGSTISGNSASDKGGGAFIQSGSLTTTGSTISGNTASDDGGGIFALSGSTTLANVTISGNAATSLYASGGGIASYGTLTATNTTITGNTAYYGGGISAYGTETFINSIVSGNTAGSYYAPGTKDVEGSIETTTATIIGGAPGDIFASLDGAGGQLADNGGPVQTVLLKADTTNPALDIGNQPSGITEDARGKAREVDLVQADNGGTVDAGAVELQGDLESLLVTTTQDVLDPFDGVTSLREAIAFANSDPDQSDISFAAGVGEAIENGGVINLGGGQLILTSDISINGDLDGDGTADVTIDAEGNSRVMSLNGAGTDVALMGLTIQGGAADRGAGIRLYSGVSIDVTNSTITGNAASSRGGGLYNQGGTVTMAGSTISGNTSSDDGGGAFIQSGSLTATGSTISGNSASDKGGGAFIQSGSLTTTGSTISGNTASDDGGGIFALSGSTTLANVTISGNAATSLYASGGGIASYGTLTATNTTITGNTAYYGGGISAYGTETFINSIVSGNTAGSYYAPGTKDVEGSIETTTATIIGGAPGDIFASLDGAGGQLADNGGPVQTVLLKADTTNPALDIGNQPSGITEDARGKAREIDLVQADNGGTVDAGAVELQGDLESLLVTTTQDVLDPFDGVTSLREAIAFANSDPDQSTITFDGALSGGQINLGSSLEVLGSDIRIDGDINDDGVGDITIDGGGNTGRIFGVFSAGTDVVLDGLTITGGSSADRGGAIRVESDTNVTVRNSVLDGNNAMTNGGAISIDANSQLTIENSEFTFNFTGVGVSGQGGAVFVANGATGLIEGSEFSGNGARLGGGGLSNSGTVTIIDTTFDENVTLFFGGGIQNNADGVLTATNLTVANNQATSGGGIVNGGGTVSLFNATVTSNGSGGTMGGAGIASGGSLTLTNSIVLGNAFDGTPADPDQLEVFADPGTLTTVNSITGINGETATGVFRDTAEIRDTGVIGGLLENNGGDVRTVALLPDAANPALDAGVSLGEAALGTDLNGDGDMADVISLDATGNAREINQTDLTANDPNQIDLGAVEQDIQVVGPNMAPEITSDGGGDVATIDVAENTSLVTDVDATDTKDNEGAGLNYEITGGADQGLFMIDANTGVLSFIDTPDFETPGSANGENTFGVQVTVTDSGALTDVQNIVVKVTDEAAVLSLAIGPDTISENGGTATGTVTRTGDTSGALTVTLASNDTSEATVPASVAFADGETSATFTVTAQDDTDPDGDQTATITAAAPGSTDTTVAVTVTDDDQVALYTDNLFTTLVGQFPTLADALAAAAPGQAIDILDPVAVGDVGGVLISVDNLTIRGDVPFMGMFSMGAGVTSFFLDGTTDAEVSANSAGNEIEGGSGPNSINGDTGNDKLSGGGGDDDITGDHGMDTLNGNNGNDYLEGKDGADLINGGAGMDSIQGSDGDDTLNGGRDNDTVIGDDGNDSITGGSGMDQIDGGEGEDTITGGTGDDQIDGGLDADLINGNDGSDLIEGGGGNDVLLGGTGDDTLRGDSDDDEIDGGTGMDVLNGGAGMDQIDGGEGEDTITGGTGEDRINGGLDADLINGNDGSDFVKGGGGNDVLLGGIDDDTLRGNNGNDELNGGTGMDFLNGGDGMDTLMGGGDADTLQGGRDADELSGGDENDALSGGGGADILRGDAGNDTLTGGLGDDQLDGGAGTDDLRGNKGNDTLDGGSGADTVDGGAGNDVLVVQNGEGGDELTGGAGSDTFKFYGGFGTATITDFISGDDLIDLTGTSATAFGDLTIVYGADASILVGDDILTLTGVTSGLTGADFDF